MPRERRAWEPGDILSVVGRAHEGRPIFATDEDRVFFVDRLRRVFVPGETDLLAWALLVNHYHLVIRVTDTVPGTLFLRLNTVIARRERRRRGDHGAVFQDRYWSSRCQGEGSATELLTYVLGNPAHHGVVGSAAELETYPWTAYPEILGRQSPGLVDARASLEVVHPDVSVARTALREAMALRVARWQAARAGTDVCDEPGCRGAREGCDLVHSERPRARRTETAEPRRERPQSQRGISRVHDERWDRAVRLRASGWSPADLVGPVCARLGADPGAVRAGGRLRAESRSRAVIVHVACDGVGVAVREVAALMGVTAAAGTAARRRGRALFAAQGWRFDEVLSWSGAGP